MINHVIRFFRKNAGLTQHELAQWLNVDRSLISKYERGIVEPPIAILFHLAEVLQVNFSILMLCVELTKLTPSQARSILFFQNVWDYDPSNPPILQEKKVTSIAPCIIGLTEYNRQLVLDCVEACHGYYFSKYC